MEINKNNSVNKKIFFFYKDKVLNASDKNIIFKEIYKIKKLKTNYL